MTLEKFKLYLGITWTAQDSLLELFLDSSIDYVYGYIGRTLEADDYTEILNGNAQRKIVLKNYPVNTLTLFHNTGTLSDPAWEEADPDSYSIDRSGIVSLLFYQSRGFENYKAEYNAWYQVIPWDIQLAILKYASMLYNKRTSDWIKSESVWGDSLSFDIEQIPQDIITILEKYKNV